MNSVLHRIVLSVATIGLCAGAIVAASSSPTSPSGATTTQGTRTSLRTNSPQFPAGPGQPLSASFEAPFLTLNHLTDLVVTRRELDTGKLPALLANLRTQAGGIPSGTQIASVITYSGPDPSLPGSTTSNFVYGVSLIRQYGVGQERHELFRLDNASGTYFEVPELSLWMDGALLTDDLLLMNFGCVPPDPAGGPAPRTEIEVLLPPANVPFVDAWPNGEAAVELRLALLQTTPFETGMSMIGAYGGSIYAEILQDILDWFRDCNANPFCGIAIVPSTCTLTIDGFLCKIDKKALGCPMRKLNATILEGMTLPESGFATQPMAKAWEFRDTFLSKSDTGRRYTNWFYQLGALLEIDLVEVPAYVALLSKADHAMDVLLDELSTEVVISQDLADLILAVLVIQKNKITHPGMLSILDQVEADLMILTGLKRSDFVILFS